MSPQQKFVFVACGDDRHIQTVNMSARYLRRRSAKEILIVTDPARNETAIEGGTVLACATPAGLDARQAAIYLKTSLHRLLRPGDLYCYLDSDVIAVDGQVDEVFAHKRGPLTFAADHCRLRSFSPWALHCGCREKAEAFHGLVRQYQDRDWASHHPVPVQRRPLERAVAAWEGIAKTQGRLDAASRQWWMERDGLRSEAAPHPGPLPRLKTWARRRLGGGWRRLAKVWSSVRGADQERLRFLERSTGFRWDGSHWIGGDGARLFGGLDVVARFLAESGFRTRDASPLWEDPAWPSRRRDIYVLREALTGYRSDPESRDWRSAEEGEVLGQCGHLRREIEKKWGIRIDSPDWHHWNGGVFVFDHEAFEPLETWHRLTLESFADPLWRTRDQGTLVAAVWKHGLQDHSLLPQEFNLLADYHNPSLEFDPQRGFSFDGFATSVRPHFVHIYHHWGDSDWPVWRWIDRLDRAPRPEASPFSGQDAAGAGAAQ